MKIELTCPSGFKSMILSGRGSVAGASLLGAARFAAHAAAESCAGATAAPKAAPGSKGKRCSTGRSGAAGGSKPASEPTPEPTPISEIGGRIARGTPESAGDGDGPPEKDGAADGGICEA